MLNTENDTSLIREIGIQFKNNASVIEVSVLGNKVILDYCVIGESLSKTSKAPIILVAGFGSGWRGIAELGFYLASLERTVVLVSLPGYGNSSDLPAIVYSRDKFSIEANALAIFSGRILGLKKAHWVGHSMGAAIIAELACMHPMSVASLTLLNPCGFERLNSGLWLAVKFVLCGIMHRITFRGRSAWKGLQEFLPKEKNPLLLNRLSLRLLELDRLKHGCAARQISIISSKIPIAYISGEKDFVTPCKKSSIINGVYTKKRIGFVKILPLWHNTTMFSGNITANTIFEFIVGIEDDEI